MTAEQRMIERRWERQERSRYLLKKEIVFSNKFILATMLVTLSIPMPSVSEYVLCGFFNVIILLFLGLSSWWFYDK